MCLTSGSAGAKCLKCESIVTCTMGGTITNLSFNSEYFACSLECFAKARDSADMHGVSSHANQRCLRKIEKGFWS